MTQTEQARTGNANRSRDEALDYRVLNLYSDFAAACGIEGLIWPGLSSGVRGEGEYRDGALLWHAGPNPYSEYTIGGSRYRWDLTTVLQSSAVPPMMIKRMQEVLY